MREHVFGADVRACDALADSAADALSVAFHRNVKALTCVPGVHASSIYRFRRGDRHRSPLYRVALWIYAASRAGMGRHVGQTLVDWMQGVVDQCWPAETLSVEAAAVLEQAAEAEETADQVAYLSGDHSVAPRWARSLRRERAAEAVLIAALGQACAENRRAA